MGGGPKSPKKTPAKVASPKTPVASRKHFVSKAFIDDEASESGDDGVMVDGSGDLPGYGSDQNLDNYEEEFINDGYCHSFRFICTMLSFLLERDPFENRSEGSDESGFPDTLLSSPKTPPKKNLTKISKPEPVIDISSSSEEYVLACMRHAGFIDLPPRDLTAMDVDDSMYRKPGGVKSSTLPPSLVTRSATAKRAATSQSPQKTASPKKPRTTRSSANEQATEESEVPANAPVSFGTQTDMMQFMTTFMNQYLASQALPTVPKEPVRSESVPRVDFDAIELRKGLKASKQHSKKEELQSHLFSTRSSRGAGSSKQKAAKPKEDSPDWEPPYDGSTAPVDDDPAPKGKGKGKVVPRKSKASGSKADLISRVESGEDMRDAPLPETKAVAPPAVPSAAPLTLQQYFAVHGNVAATADAIAEAPEREEVDETEHSTVFMDMLETYKAYYDPLAVCGVNDEDLQDPVLVNSYVGQPPLPGDRSLLAVYDPSRLSGQEREPVKGGRVKFSTWARYIPSILADNAIGAVLFREADPNFINPSRVSPLLLSCQVTAGSAATQRLMVNGRVAMCVTSIFCTESFLVDAKKIGANTDRTRKWLSGIPHNQDFERLESLFCLVLGEHVLYAQITPKKALSFQTMMSPANAAAVQDVEDAFTSAPSDMFAPVTPSKSPAKAKSPSKTWNYTSKTLLAAHDKVPIYDARTVVFDFNSDLSRLSTVLPAFHGEIPFGSFVVVGYTVAGYKASLSAGGERVPHLGCNILWAIVCGSPPLKGKSKQ
ncbi:hypothetical protein DFH06DRAFT_1141828 [Mycena polygramma]|nr:hypothetical protein DFH06DRAFT_1141828 [Mycena polygramma]